MKFSSAALSLAALAAGASAQLSILSPGGPDLWWVADSDNVVSWTCQTSPYTNFTVLITNSDPSILVSPLAFIAQQNNFDCSKLITKQQITLNAGSGYTIQLANPFNNTDVYAQSEAFEIKPLGSAYPSTTASVAAASTGSASGTASAATTTGSSASDNTTSSSGAFGLTAPGMFTAAACAVLGLMFA